LGIRKREKSLKPKKEGRKGGENLHKEQWRKSQGVVRTCSTKNSEEKEKGRGG